MLAQMYGVKGQILFQMHIYSILEPVQAFYQCNSNWSVQVLHRYYLLVQVLHWYHKEIALLHKDIIHNIVEYQEIDVHETNNQIRGFAVHSPLYSLTTANNYL